MADSTSAPEASNTTENIDPNVLGLPEDDTAGFDEIFANYREQRLAQMKKEAAQKEAMKINGHGEYLELKTEKEFLSVTTKIKHVICHFYHKDFVRCRIVDKHFAQLAPKHFQCKFVKINVESAPFFVEKLQIKTLPCIVSFINGVVQDRLVGFSELGNTDNFPLSRLETRLAKSGVIKATAVKDSNGKKESSIMRGTSYEVAGDEEDDD